MLLRTTLLLLMFLASGVALAQPLDVAGWEQARWGMNAEQLKAALGPVLIESRTQIGLPLYTAEAKFAGLTLPVQFTMTPGRGLTEVRLGGGWADHERETEALAVEAALIAAYGLPQGNQVSDQRTPQGGREVSKVFSWTFPSTVISYRRGFTTGGAEGVQDLVSISYQVQR